MLSGGTGWPLTQTLCKCQFNVGDFGPTLSVISPASPDGHYRIDSRKRSIDVHAGVDTEMGCGAEESERRHGPENSMRPVSSGGVQMAGKMRENRP